MDYCLGKGVCHINFDLSATIRKCLAAICSLASKMADFFFLILQF